VYLIEGMVRDGLHGIVGIVDEALPYRKRRPSHLC